MRCTRGATFWNGGVSRSRRLLGSAAGEFRRETAIASVLRHPLPSFLVRGLLILLVPIASVLACRTTKGDSNLEGEMTRPTELVGRWVRMREDRTWGDTLEYLADGHVAGSQGHAGPPSARWGVKAGPPRQACFWDASEGGMCRTFELRGDTLSLDSGPSAPTIFRRVR